MTEEESQKLQNELEIKLKEIYPDFQFGYSHGSSINGIVSSQVYEFWIDQDSIRNSEYGNINCETFIHYTSLKSFCEILNSGEIRLFDLNNMNDPFEFDYLLRENNLDFNQRQIDFFKKRLFVTSLCKYNEKSGDDFNLWRLYGENGSGIAIVFKLLNPNANWNNFLISNIIYGSENEESNKLVSAVKILKEYINKGIDRIPQLIGLLLVHHKNKIWSIENECRLSTFCDNDEYSLQTHEVYNPFIEGSLRRIVRADGIPTSFIAFPLEFKLKHNHFKNIRSAEEFNNAKSLFPRFSIEKVILGYKLSEKVFDDTIFFCSATAHDYWNNFIKVEK